MPYKKKYYKKKKKYIYGKKKTFKKKYFPLVKRPVGFSRNMFTKLKWSTNY